MRKPLARRKVTKHRNISTQIAVHSMYALNPHYNVILTAFDKALEERTAAVLAIQVKKIMDVEPSTDDLDIRTYQN